MKYPELINYIKLNISIIYNNFTSVFKMNIEDFRLFIINLVDSFKYNRVFNSREYSQNAFSNTNLQELKNELIKLGLSEDEIKNIIIKSPIIILYSDRLSDIYYLYKNSKYYGYVILDDGEYDTFLLNENLSSNIVSNNFVTRKMLEYYNVTKFDKATFDRLEADYKLKNYYFKRKTKNPQNK